MKDKEDTIKDVYLEKNYFVRCVGIIKGKNVHNRAKAFRDGSVEIPKELLSIKQGIILSIDRLTVDSLQLLISVSHDACYRASTRLSRT